ncbi:MAG: large-conductance mechanosensitive channel protein MscL [Candidatus Kryptoniota bacterium]
MKIAEEFKQFAIKGNVVDMAIGIVIGAAFGTVVKSMVDDIITPPLGKLLGGMDFSNLYINLSSGSYNSLSAAKQAGAATLNYGLFINSVISFIIVAFALFIVVKMMNKLKREPPPVEPNTKTCPQCQSTISMKALRCPFCTSQL